MGNSGFRRLFLFILDGEKAALTPAGKPLADIATLCAAPVIRVAVTVTVAVPPALIVTD